MARSVISEDGPSPVEKAHDLTLVSWVEAAQELQEETERRGRALDQLSQTCKQWIRYVLVTECGLPAQEDYGGRIFTTGSYRHNVHSSGSDIDVVLIAPARITRQHFFTSLVERLRDLRGVTDLTLAEEAIVPLISFKYEGVDIDLALVAIRQEHVPDTLDPLDDRIHIGLDDRAVKSVNGVRDALLLINLVPNTTTFRRALRFIKHWGKKRGIYGAKVGFTSGIGFAIMVAKVVQCYPNLNSAGIVLRFFKMYRGWFTPTPTPSRPNRPIFITQSLPPAKMLPGLPNSWNPRDTLSDGKSVYPIITPAYPCQNSCYNVSLTTLAVICEEIALAHDKLLQHMDAEARDAPALAKASRRKLATEGRLGAEAARDATSAAPPELPAYAESQPFGVWSRVLEDYNPFATSQYFLHVAVSVTHFTEYDLWVDYVEAKLRFLWTEMSFNRGFAFECFPQVKIRVITRRYEEPAQMETLSRLKAQAKAAAARRAAIGGSGTAVQPGTAAAAALPPDLGMGSPLGSATLTGASPDPRASANALATPARGSAGPGAAASPQQNVTDPTVPAVFTCNFYFPITMDSEAKDSRGQSLPKPDLKGIRNAWLRKITADQPRVTHAQLPTVDIVRRSTLPSWLPGLSEAAAATPASKAEGTSSAAAAPAPQQQQPPDAATVPVPAVAATPVAPPRPETVVPSLLQTPATGTAAPIDTSSKREREPAGDAAVSVIKPPQPAPQPPKATAAEAEELLGLDF